MSAWIASERFWIDAMNVGVAVLVAVPFFVVLATCLFDMRRKA